MNTSKERAKIPPILFLVYAGLFTGIVFAAYLYYQDYREKSTDREMRALSIVGEFRREQIAEWVSEQKNDAMVLHERVQIKTLLQLSLQGRMDTLLRTRNYQYLSAVQRYEEYDRISIIGLDGREIVAAPRQTQPLSRFVAEQIPAAIAADKLTFIDFYRNEFNQKIYLGILNPVEEDTVSRHVIGVVFLRIDPETYLFPLLKKTTALHPDIRTLIVRRDGDSIVFLNDLVGVKNAALSKKISVHEQQVLGVKAASGMKGLTEGIDYLGTPVIGYLNAIPGTAWYVVAMMDKDVIVSKATERLWYVMSIIVILLISSGSVIGIFWHRQSINMYREKLQSMHDLAFLQEMVKYSLNEIIIFDESSLRIIFVNDGACESLGYRLDELQGRDIFMIKPAFTEEQYRAQMQLLITGEKKFLVFETVHRRKDGTQYPVEAHLQRMMSDDRSLFLVVANDITQRKQNEQQIAETLQELERSNKELEQFAYVASHDLQEPLRMVASYTQLLERRYKDKLDADAADFIKFAVEGANRMQQLINDLLEYSRVSTRGKDFVAVNMMEVLGEVLVNLQQKIQENSAVITIADLPTITADPAQLSRLFQNLIDNALKYRKAGVPPVITLTSAETGDAVEFMVKDNGIGIDPKYHDRVFVIFQRLHAKEEYDGSGIGLAICKRIVERHGGKIWFEPVPEGGTTFHLTFSKRVQPFSGERRNDDYVIKNNR